MAKHLTLVVDEGASEATIRCTGELDLASAPEVEAAFAKLLDDRVAGVHLDWSGLTFMDSTGIRVLLRIVKGCKSAGMDLTWSLSPPARKALDLVGIHDTVLEQLT